MLFVILSQIYTMDISLKRSIASIFIVGEESPGKTERRSVESTDICESIEMCNRK